MSFFLIKINSKIYKLITIEIIDTLNKSLIVLFKFKNNIDSLFNAVEKFLNLILNLQSLKI